MSEYERLYSFMDQDKRSMLKLWFARREINLLVAGLRHMFTHEKIADDVLRQGQTPFFKQHSNIDVAALSAAKTLPEVIAACKNTPYAPLLQRADEASSDFFSIAMMLDGYYYKSLWKAKDKYLDKSEQGIFRELEGSVIDMLNVMWIYRGRKYFEFDSELIYTYLLPVRYRLTQEQITAMVSGPEPEKVISQTPYAHLLSMREAGYFVEEVYRKTVYQTSRRIFRDHPKTMAAVFAYLHIKEYEINNITMITEGVRYSYDPSAIRKHIDIAGRDA
jgi:V/A-type H+-transporting ATPase subunit C